jgi:uncharacterized protein (DUF1015 family)
MRIYSFPGLRFDARRVDPSDHTAPPFDQISDALRDRLHRQEHHFAHLTRPVAAQGLQAPDRAAHLHQSWRDGGLVAQESSLALYPYRIRLSDGGQRLGLGALVGLEEPSSGVVRPHEETVARTVAERLRLLSCMQADLEPILVLSDDGGRLEELLQEDIADEPSIAAHQDLDGNRHLLYRIVGAERIRQYQEILDPCSALIADGHHRWQVARRYAAEVAAPAGSAPACKLAVITSLRSPGLRIDPIHRSITRHLELAGLDESNDLVKSQRGWQGQSGRQLASAVGQASQPALGVRLAGSPPEIWELAAPAEQLAVRQLHDEILPRLGLADSAASDGTVAYRSDPDELYQAVERGEVAAGFWLPSIQPAALHEAVADGRLLPPKATRFLPKLISGLVWVDHNSEIA